MSAAFPDIGLMPAQVKAVARRARQADQTPAEYLRSLVERDLAAGDTFDEVLRPVRDGFKKSGVTEDELDALVTRARKHIHSRARRKARP